MQIKPLVLHISSCFDGWNTGDDFFGHHTLGCVLFSWGGITTGVQSSYTY